MRQSEIFDKLLNRAISAEVAVVQERARANAAIERADNLAKERCGVISVQHVHDLMHHMANGRKIEAIKAHRTMTGFGLKESKDAVDSVMDRVR
jgi:ribosomal protein L7/L12